MDSKRDAITQIEICKRCKHPSPTLKCRNCGHISWSIFLWTIKIMAQFGIAPLVIGIVIPGSSTFLIVIKWALILFGTFISGFLIYGIMAEVTAKTGIKQEAITEKTGIKQELTMRSSIKVKRLIQLLEGNKGNPEGPKYNLILSAAKEALDKSKSSDPMESLIKRLIKLLTDKAPYADPEGAAEALGILGAPRATKALIATLRNPKVFYTHRSAAAIALGKISSESAIDALIASLLDQEVHGLTREAAAISLSRFNDPRAYAALSLADHIFAKSIEERILRAEKVPVTCIYDPDSRVRERAHSVLNSILNSLKQSTCYECKKKLYYKKVGEGSASYTGVYSSTPASYQGWVCESCGRMVCISCANKLGYDPPKGKDLCFWCGHNQVAYALESTVSSAKHKLEHVFDWVDVKI